VCGGRGSQSKVDDQDSTHSLLTQLAIESESSGSPILRAALLGRET
jgi:polyhydroxyalkanoate synthesis regulator protein